MKALVVGGGIAGPATAMALQRVGVDATVLERRPGPDLSGSVFTVSPNGLSALDSIGALHLAREIGFPTRDNLMYGATGRFLGRVTLGTPLPDGTQALTMRRGELGAALGAEAQRRGIEVRYAARVTSLRNDGSGAVATLEDGTELRADLLVGADGVHSVVRRHLDPQAPKARYVGLTNFGGTTKDTDWAAKLEPEAWTFTFGRKAFFGATPTPSGDVIWFVNVPEPEISREQRRSTTPEEWRQRLLALVEDDTSAASELIGAGHLDLAGDNTYDLGHVPVWHDDRSVVVGDAAHAPSPSSGQGASMALEDAVALAVAVRDTGTVAEALAAYEDARRERVERIVAVGARSSSTKIPGRVGRVFQEAMLRVVFRHVVTDARQEWMTGYRSPVLEPGPRATVA
jgi:2-polyprenyl-6-methoxyphenol hydroxylase-like FAD-dependent oxidoreductase